MNRRTVLTSALIISLIANIILFVFASIQKTARDAAMQAARDNKEQAEEMSKRAVAIQTHCEILRAEANEARQACETKLAQLSKKR
jgi:hypothetical protein